MSGTVTVGSGPTNYFRQYSTGIPEYTPGSGPIGLFANKAAAGTYGNHRRSGNIIDSRQNTIMRPNQVNLARRQSDFLNPSLGTGIPQKQKPAQGQSGNTLATSPLLSQDIPDLPAATGGWAANKLFGSTYPGSGSRANKTGSGDYSGGLAQRKSELTDGQSVFSTTATISMQQRSQFRYNAANLGQTRNPSAFGRSTGITNTTSLANRASSLK